MLKSELVALIAARYEFPHHRVADQVVNTVLEAIVNALALGRRVKLRNLPHAPNSIAKIIFP